MGLGYVQKKYTNRVKRIMNRESAKTEIHMFIDRPQVHILVKKSRKMDIYCK